MDSFSKFKILIAEPIDDLEDTYQVLREMGCELVVGPPVSCSNQGYSEEQLVEICKDVDALFGMSREDVTRKVIESSPKLRVICKYGTGVNNIDVQAATEHGVIVANAPVHNVTVAEYTFLLILSLLKKLPYNIAHLQNGGWRDSSTIGSELYHKTVGIVGFGNIGKQVAKRLQGWETNVIVCDPLAARESAELLGAKSVDWNTLFETADIISLHLPLLDTTRGIVGEKEFKMMKNTAILVNDSRGAVVNEEALIKALQEKEIAGAALDVFPTEGVEENNPLRKMENVVLTPHVAGYTFESLRRIAEQATKNCIAALKGEIPEFIVNRAVLPQWTGKYCK